MRSKIIGTILVASAVAIFMSLIADFEELYFSPGAKIKTAVERDLIKNLERSDATKINEIHHIKLSSHLGETLSFLKNYPPNLPTHKIGSIWLEIEYLDLTDPEKPGFITQTSIFDLKTKNKIDEFAETYYLKDFDQKFEMKFKKPSQASKKAPDKNKKAD